MIKGLGSAVVETIASSGINIKSRRFALSNKSQNITGSKILAYKNEMWEENIVDVIIKEVHS